MRTPIKLDQNTDSEFISAPRSARRRIIPTLEQVSSIGRSTSRELAVARSRPRFSGDRAMLELQRQLALDPDLIPEPSSQANAIIRPLLIRICSVSALAALVAWGLASYSDVKKNAQGNPASQFVPAISSDHALKETEPVLSRPTMSQSEKSIPPVVKSSPVLVATVERVAPPRPSIPTAGTARLETPSLRSAPPEHVNDRPVLRLDSDETEALLKRAQDLIADGDLAAARLLLRRAAEAGIAEAAFTLGTTYDPVVLQRLGAIGTAADPIEARQWYQRAAALGSTAASQQLAVLGDPR